MTEPDQDLERVFAHIDANRESYVTRVMDYVRHKSISASNEGIAEAADLLVGMLCDLGMQVEKIATANHPMVIARRETQPGRPTVLLYGHYDVQPPEPLELWKSPPFEPEIRDNRIFARGIGDNKGQHFAQLLAIEAYLAVVGDLPCNVIFLLEGEEEIGSPQMADFVRSHADKLDADLVITADGSLHDSGRAIVTFGVRGVASFELKAKTANRDAHSGNFGGVMPNAIWKLVHLLATMKNERGEITIEGLSDPVLPPTDLERAAMAALPLDVEKIKAELGLADIDEPLERPYWERLMFQPTLTINGLHGGYGGPGQKTVLPSEAFAKCDIRLVENLTPDYVFDKVRAHVEKYAPDVEFIAANSMLPSKTPIDSPFVPAIREAIVAARGVEPLLYPSLGGSLPDYVFTKILKKPAFVVPYANADQANHAPNENLRLDLFFEGIRTGAALLAKLGAMKT
ncbi:MAG: M20/M25/M40 family metallo-hydrolase [Neorhizobium sp.]|nr:M20/M25/M40 family metallo-hydrolase [Neorhizobium sp.]